MTDTTTTPASSSLPTSLSSLTSLLDGNKMYIGCAAAALVVALNHFGLWPQSIIPLTIDPAQWITDEWTIYLVATGRSVAKKLET